jgi:hypothetical protein
MELTIAGFLSIGFFMIAIGAGIIWSPGNLWAYIVGIFLIVPWYHNCSKTFEESQLILKVNKP